MDLADWQRRLSLVGASIKRFGGEASDFLVGQPASEAALAEVERELGRPLPAGLRARFRDDAELVHFEWSLRDSFEPLPEELVGLTMGRWHWALGDIVECEGLRAAHARTHTGEHWQHSLAFAYLQNGDFLAVDTRGAAGRVILLSDSDSTVDGAVLGRDMEDFLGRWTVLGCPGAEVDDLAPFLRATRALEPNGPAGKLWRAWLHLPSLASAA
jgi:hypothetical protein